MRRHAVSLDANHATIVRCLKQVGCGVIELARGGLSPDLLVLTPRRKVVLLEIKTEDGELNATQRNLVAGGWPIVEVRNEFEAFAACGVRVTT